MIQKANICYACTQVMTSNQHACLCVQLTRIVIRAFGAGRQPSVGVQRLADSAATALRKALKAGLHEEQQYSVEVEALHEPPGRAVGDGWGLSMTAETSTGCLLGACEPAKRLLPKPCQAHSFTVSITSVWGTHSYGVQFCSSLAECCAFIGHLSAVQCLWRMCRCQCSR
jgi:hypothetical protein